jgi:hypothetical protein
MVPAVTEPGWRGCSAARAALAVVTVMAGSFCVH